MSRLQLGFESRGQGWSRSSFLVYFIVSLFIYGGGPSNETAAPRHKEETEKERENKKRKGREGGHGDRETCGMGVGRERRVRARGARPTRTKTKTKRAPWIWRARHGGATATVAFLFLAFFSWRRGPSVRPPSVVASRWGWGCLLVGWWTGCHRNEAPS